MKIPGQKLRIGVLMGGKSIEREVSFNSGRTICDHLDTQRYTIVPIFQTATGQLYHLPWHFLHRGKISDFVHRLEQEATSLTWDGLKACIDFIYPAMHGRFAEDGTMQGILEVLNIPYLGSKVMGSALGMNKIMQKTVLAMHGIDVAKGITITPAMIHSLSQDAIADQLTAEGISFPVVVKPAHEGSSLGVSVVFNQDELLNAIAKASSADDRRIQAVLIEERLEGMEFVCVSLEKVSYRDGKKQREWFSLPITEVVIEKDAHLFDYEQKYMPGRALKITPARSNQADTDRIIAVCERAAQLLHFSTISRIDGFLTTDGRVVIIDPNSLTGMSPSTFIFNQAAEYGMSHTQLINFLIEQELVGYDLVDNRITTSEHEDTTMNTVSSKKVRVAVLLGGDSNEREISLESGRNVCYKLSPQTYEALPIFINEAMEIFHIPQRLLIKNTTRAIADLVTPEMQLQWSDLPSVCDFVFIALHGGKGENGAVQGTLEMLGLPYNGSGVLTSALCMDKAQANAFLRAQGFEVPRNILLHKDAWLAQTPLTRQTFLQALLENAALTLPLILKPHDDGCSVMVQKVTSVDLLASALDTYFLSSKTAAFIEELINGVELTCGVTGNDQVVAMPPSMAVAQGGILSIQEKFLPGAGENQTPAPLPQPILALVQDVMARAYTAVGCKGYARIDCFYQTAQQSPTGKDRVVLLEFNTLPGLTPATCLFHQAAELGIQPMGLIDTIVQLGFQLHQAPVHTSMAKSAPVQIIVETETPIEEETLIIEEEITVQAPESSPTISLADAVAPTLQAQPASGIVEEVIKEKVEPTDFILKMF